MLTFNGALSLFHCKDLFLHKKYYTKSFRSRMLSLSLSVVECNFGGRPKYWVKAHARMLSKVWSRHSGKCTEVGAMTRHSCLAYTFCFCTKTFYSHFRLNALGKCDVIVMAHYKFRDIIPARNRFTYCGSVTRSLRRCFDFQQKFRNTNTLTVRRIGGKIFANHFWTFITDF